MDKRNSRLSNAFILNVSETNSKISEKEWIKPNNRDAQRKSWQGITNTFGKDAMSIS